MTAISRATRAAREARRTEAGDDRIPAPWRGVVTEIRDDGVYITIPRLTDQARHGPVALLEGLDLAEGDRVLVLMVEGRKSDPVIVGRLAR